MLSVTTTTAPAWPKLHNLEKFKPSGAGQFVACCPAHHDRNPSLSIGVGTEGVIGLTCHAGCDKHAILSALGCEMGDLFPPKPQPSNGDASKPRIVATYDYRDERRALLYQAVRYVPKDFKRRRPDGHEGWVWKLDDVRRVPFRLPELLADLSGELWIFEGEKDAMRAASLGLNATTTIGGADNFAMSAESMRAVATGKRVFLVADEDDAGDKYVAAGDTKLRPVAQALRIIHLPRLTHTKEHGEDFSDRLDRYGGTVDELWTLAADEGAQTCSNDVEGVHTSDEHLSDWDGGTLLCDVTPEDIEWLWEGYIPLRKLTMGDGDPGLGKTMLFAADLAARVTTGDRMPDGTPGIAGGAAVVIFTAEDDPADTLLPRLVAAGGDPSKALVITTIQRPDPDSLTGAMVERLPTFADLDFIRRKVEQVNAKLVIFDPFMAYLPSTANSFRDQDVRAVLAPLARLAQASGAAFVLIRHLNKGNFGSALYRGGGSIGIIGAARSGLLVVKDPDDENARIFGRTKSNLFGAVPSWKYRIGETDSGAPAVEWGGQSERSAEDVLNISGERDTTSKLEAALDLLRKTLSEGAEPEEKLQDAAKAQGISKATLRRAKKALGVQSEKVGIGKNGYWLWSLTETESRKGDHDSDEGAHTSDDEHLSENVGRKGSQEADSPKGAHASRYEQVSKEDDHLRVDVGEWPIGRTCTVCERGWRLPKPDGVGWGDCDNADCTSIRSAPQPVQGRVTFAANAVLSAVGSVVVADCAEEDWHGWPQGDADGVAS